MSKFKESFSVPRSTSPDYRLTSTYSAYKCVGPKKFPSSARGWKEIAAHNLSPHNDAIWIQHAIKSVYKPHGLPKDINDLSTRIKFTDAVELRKICDFIRANQWAYICEQKLQFREQAWQKMRIEHMRPGNLKENFINTFAIYLPYASHLPINNNKTVPSSSRSPL